MLPYSSPQRTLAPHVHLDFANPNFGNSFSHQVHRKTKLNEGRQILAGQIFVLDPNLIEQIPQWGRFFLVREVE